jgi:hypothetical protein
MFELNYAGVDRVNVRLMLGGENEDAVLIKDMAGA